MRLAFTLAAGIAAMLSASDAHAQAREPYFGRYGTQCAMPDVSGAVGGDGPVAPSVVPAAADKLLGEFFDAIAKGASTEKFLDRRRLPDATLESCTNAFAKLQTSTDCKTIPNYLLGDEEIRVEWLCRGKSAYMAFFTIVDGKISNIWALDRSNMPPIAVSGSGND